MTSAKLRIPYDEARLGSYNEQDLTVLHRDEHLGAWIPFGGAFTVDTTNNIVEVTTTDFSAYAVAKIPPDAALDPPADFGYVCQGTGSDSANTAIALTVDVSGSMVSQRDTEVAILDSLIDELADPDLAGLIQFNDVAQQLAPLTELTTAGRTALKDAIDGVAEPSGGTNITSGVQAALGMLSGVPAGTRARMAVLSDGDGAYNTALTTQARDRSVAIDTVSMGGSSTTLQEMSQQTGGTYVEAGSRSADSIARDLTLGLIDNQHDTDGDGLTDCQERAGVVVGPTIQAFLDGASNAELVATRATSDPDDADTDDDGLSDGEEAGPGSTSPISTALPLSYLAACRPSASTYFYAGYSDPRLTDTDDDFVSDFDEIRGIEVFGVSYDSDPRLVDTDSDLSSDRNEYYVGTDPKDTEPRRRSKSKASRPTTCSSRTTTTT